MRKHWPFYLYLICWASYFTVFWLHVVSIDEQGNLLVGQANMWADWAWHFTLSHSIAERGWPLTDSPLLADSALSYPFFSSLLSAILIKLSVPTHWSHILPSLMFNLLLIWALYYFFLTLLKRPSIAIIGACLFLLNGGLGFVHFFEALAQAQFSLDLLFAPPQQYTHLPDQNIFWISIVNSMIIPQRSLTMGLPLTLLALSWVYQLAFNPVEQAQKRFYLQRAKWCSAILILGMMPIIHSHSFLAAFVILACWSLFDLISQRSILMERIRFWLPIALLISCIALPMISLFLLNNIGESFIRWYPGWYAREKQINWLQFWLNNWSFIPLLALVGTRICLMRKKIHALRDWLPFWLLFAAVNLWIFQPWIWDNTKLLLWVAIGFSALAAQCLYSFWQHIWFNQYQQWQKIVNRICTICLLIICCLSGFLDVYSNSRLSLHTYTLYTAEELALAQWAKQQTPLNSRWLISDKHNHWVLNLTGRQALMGYSGWLWSHGYDYSETALAVKSLYSTADPSLIEKYNLDYLVIGPEIRREYPEAERIFRQQLELVHSTKNYQIFKY